MNESTSELEGLRKLYEFTRHVLSGQARGGALRRLVEATRELTNADHVYLFTHRNQGLEIRARATSEYGDDLGDSHDEEGFSTSIVNRVFESGQPLLVNDLPNHPVLGRAPSIMELSLRSAICAPYAIEGRIAGVIYASVHRITDAFTAWHLELLKVAASQAGLLLSSALVSEALRESEARHRSVVEMSRSAIVVVGGDEVLFANQAAHRLWGMSPQDFVARRLAELFDGWRSGAYLESVEQRESVESAEAWAVRGDGSTLSVEASAQPIVFDGRDAMQLMISGVAEKKAILAERLRMDRLVVMGTMAATVGHEINNPLSYVHANLDYALEELDVWMSARGYDDTSHGLGEVFDGLRSALEGAERIRGVVESIQSFSALERGMPSATWIDQPLYSSVRMARGEMGPRIEIDLQLASTSPVTMSQAQLGQIFMNLLINAAHALSDASVPQPRVVVRSRQEGDWVWVEFEDNGPGIDEAVLPHVFEPFVTTKEASRGTGLGLAICHQIVADCGGIITAERGADGGCLMRLRLPAASDPTTQIFEVFENEGESERRGKVLVVDPDPTIGASLKRVLRAQHDVDVVTDVEEATRALGRAMPEYDVVLCDVRLRGGAGLETVQWVRRHAPRYWQRLVAMTASACSSSQQLMLDELPNPWLRKPFELANLRGIVAALVTANEESRAREQARRLSGPRVEAERDGES
ncbi:GAF domain-containing protein [Lujinxingia vulgaris]|uniref:histidine kinase n=1 Tax=Lujinxingia vulgaris TaxID=2600176 RepID=A0A5C6X8U4_9DELT|nr:ATP-binding protein [Lujinxingia vulgaris]TXD38241.1 GAF domain-containing protein [Lujinxingia vulgaris]